MPQDQTSSWRRSTFCVTASCVEVTPYGDSSVALRDSKNPDKGFHVFDAAEWTAFVQGVRAGEFDIYPS